jgi:Fe-S oxidoreductase
VIANIWEHYLSDRGVEELVCFHDECYGTYTRLAPAFGIKVPFKPVHIFDYLNKRLDELKDRIQPLGQKVAYQRSCSNRLVPETQPWMDEIFKKIGAERVDRKYDRENALCCGTIFRAQQKDDLADDVQKRNLDDMAATGAKFCVFSCPACLFTLGESVFKRGIMPILLNDLCQIALGEGMKGG